MPETTEIPQRPRDTYEERKARYNPPDGNLLSKINSAKGFHVRGYHLLYNDENPATNHLVADVAFSSDTTRRVEAVFQSSDDEYDEQFFSEFEKVLDRISTYFSPFFRENGDIESFKLNIKGTPVQLRFFKDL